MISKFIFCTLLLLNFSIFAANPTKEANHKPSSVDRFTLEVSFGEKVSLFKIWGHPSRGHFSFSENSSTPRSGNLSLKDYQFLTSQAARFKEMKSNDSLLCSRSFIKITANNGLNSFEKIGCIGSKTPVAAELTKLANTLNLIL